jgi:hypothetical protein
VAFGYSTTSPTVPLGWGTNNATTTSATIYIVRNNTHYDTTPTIEETRSSLRPTVVYTSYTNYPQPEALPPSRWYDPPLVSPSGRGPVGAYEATVRPRTTVWRCAPRASARRCRFNWRKRPHGAKRRKLR